VANRWVMMEKARWSPSHLQETQGRLNRHIFPKWGARHLDDIDPVEVSAWVDDLHQTHRGTGTRTIYQAFSTPVSWALKQGLIDHDPCRGVSVPVDFAEPITIPSAEAIRRTIYQTKDPMWKALVVLASVTGLRRGELCGLQWRDIGDDYLVVTRAISGTKAEVKAPKSVASRRRISVPPRAMRWLSEWMSVQAERMEQDLGVDHKPGHFVFTRDHYALKPMPPASITQWWIRNRCDDTIRFHDLRHFNVSELLAAGVDPTTVAKRMGHSPGVMFTTYAHLIPERDADASAIMEGRLNAPWSAAEREALGLAPKDEIEEDAA
jgi:integrase